MVELATAINGSDDDLVCAAVASLKPAVQRPVGLDTLIGRRTADQPWRETDKPARASGAPALMAGPAPAVALPATAHCQPVAHVAAVGLPCLECYAGKVVEAPGLAAAGVPVNRALPGPLLAQAHCHHHQLWPQPLPQAQSNQASHQLQTKQQQQEQQEQQQRHCSPPADGSVGNDPVHAAAAHSDGGASLASTAAHLERSAAAAAACEAAVPRKGRLHQLFDYLLVMDLEATCARDKQSQPMPQEIIELSCCVVDTAALALLPASFQRYVRPDQHPRLSTFCTQLTGITQDMVDGGVPLHAALADLEAWLRLQGLAGNGKTFVPVTWRDWDLKVQMQGECKWRGIRQPRWQQRWVDLAAVWAKHGGAKGNLRASCKAAGLGWQGRAHSAADDARNTARLAIHLMRGGIILGVTGSFTGVDASGRFRQATLLAGGGVPHQQGPLRKKQRVFDDAGAWTGCCYCGARAKKRTVRKPGPNNGRDFWSCGKYSHTGGGARCDFFKMVHEADPPPRLPGGQAGRGGSRGWVPGRGAP